jgi:hypothetical protein
MMPEALAVDFVGDERREEHARIVLGTWHNHK